ncbi:MAG: trehalose-6-phosphate synthase [Candidatus Colwellbacteria bacterium]|nr:trehalose-6-phosphate synthase [Candidatus Colwellbacteria bacterium]
MWTRDDLHNLVKEKLSGFLFVAVSNREPYIHTFSGSEIIAEVPASGLTTALDPVMQACGGTWIANGRGEADRKVVDKDNKVMVPPENPRYSLRRVWVSREEEEGYYYGFSNNALWPLCHIAYTRPIFKESDWDNYKKVNEIFAQAVLDEVKDKKAFVFIQDYHLTLLPGLIKERNPDIISAQFWHIPWPNREAFRICPWKEEIIRGLLGNDLLGFHIRYHCNNFLDTVDQTIESKIDWERYEVTSSGKKTGVRPFPISIDFEEISSDAQKKDVDIEIKRMKSRLGLNDEMVGVGFDRMDYTKGIPDRILAVSHFFEKYPEYRGRMVFIQAGVPSRTELAAYKRLDEEVDKLVRDTNERYSKGSWKPIIYLREHLHPITMMALRRMADYCVVSSLHDGMNLVAKEYVASRFDEDGVLILSPFTGASRELTDALLVNPYATDHFAEAIKDALEMPEEERRKRMKKMREVVRENNVYKWAADIITELVKFEFGK